MTRRARAGACHATGGVSAGTMMEMTYPEIAAAAERKAGVLVPIGVIEQHGPHLPIGTDALIAGDLCRLTRDHAGARDCELVIAPPFYWGVNSIFAGFPGTFRTRPEVSAALLTDVIDTLVETGFVDVYLVSHHGDRAHNEMVRGVVEAQHAAGRTRVLWAYAPVRWATVARLGMTGREPIWLPWDRPDGLDELGTTGILGVHAHEEETAAVVRFHPHLVDFDALRDLEPTRLGPDDLAEWRKGGEHARRLTPDGYFGAPRPIDPELWRHYDLIARAMAEAIAART